MRWKTRKKTNNRIQSAQEFINVEAVERDLLWTRDKRLFAYIRVRGQDNSLLGDAENDAVTERLTVALSEETEPWQILSIPRTVDTQGMIQDLRRLRESSASDVRTRLIDGELDALEELTESGAKEPVVLLKIWKDATRNAHKQLLDRAAGLISRLEDNQIAAYQMRDEQIRLLCTIFAELGVWQDSDVQSDVTYLKGKNRRFSRKPSPEELALEELLEQITPVGGLFFRPDSLMIGGTWCRCYGVTRYPAEIDYGWAVKLMGAADCVTCITYYPGRDTEIGDALSRSVRDSSREAREQRDPRTRKILERKASSADRLIDDLDAKSKALGHMSIVVMPFAESEASLEQTCRDVTLRFAAKRMKLKVLSCLQKEAFRHLSPYYPNQPEIDGILRRIVPLETVIGGYPCTVSTLRDDHGSYFARTADRGLVTLDILYRGYDRTNGNGITTGIPGTGKSTMLKHLLQSQYMRGMKIIVIDPEREFRALCRSLNGAWWDAGGGTAHINLLQMQAPVPVDPEDADTSADMPEEPFVYRQIQTVQNILGYLLPGLDNSLQALLKRALRELYAKFGIPMDWQYDPARPATDYPVLEDLYRLLLDKRREDARYEELALLVEDMAIGADAVIWNGHTDICLDNDLVVIDTNRLWGGTERNRAAQYYNLLRMAFSAVSADKDTPYLIIADEAQTLFDPELPQIARDLRNIALRIRKYEGCLWLAFHSLHELLDERVREWGQPILDAAAYKILFGTDGQNLADTASLFHLTASELKVLEARQRGKALALIGPQHLKVEFDIPAYKLALMGRGGGR